MFCSKCGERVDDEDIFCFKCGAKLKKYSNQVHNENDLSNQNNVEAMVELGDKYRYGDPDQQNLEKAFECYRKAAEQGSIEAVRKIGGISSFLHNGKAYEWLRTVAEQGNIEAMCILGNECRHDKKNDEKALEWYRRASERGSTEAMCEIGDIYRDQGNDEKAFEWYQRAADEGYGRAKDKLAYIEDFKEWVRKAEAGNISAMLKVGKMYRDGGAVVGRNCERALEWYQKAATQGNVESMFEIGYIYQMQGSYKKALEWYLRNEDKCDASVMCRIAYIYRDSYKDYEKALEWFKKAADRGKKVAVMEIERINASGYVVKDECSQPDDKM